jgi:hypothetical protein
MRLAAAFASGPKPERLGPLTLRFGGTRLGQVDRRGRASRLEQPEPLSQTMRLRRAKRGLSTRIGQFGKDHVGMRRRRRLRRVKWGVASAL